VRSFVLPIILASVAVASAAEAAAPATTRAASRPTTEAALSERISRAIPVIRCDDPNIRSFDVEGKMVLGRMNLLFHLSQPEPGRCALRVTHEEGIPLIIWADGRALFNDVSRNVIVYVPNASMGLTLGMDGDKVSFNLSPSMPLTGPAKWNFRIDPLSILSAGSTRGRKTGPDRYVVRTELKEGRWAEAQIDFARKTPLMSFRSGQGKDAITFLPKVAVNEPVDLAACAMPEVDALKAALTVEEVKDVPSMARALPAMVRSWGMVMATMDLDARAEAEKEFGKIDWDAAKAKQEATGKMLSELLKRSKPREVGAPATRAGTAPTAP
jgi:hypothetical protein